MQTSASPTRWVRIIATTLLLAVLGIIAGALVSQQGGSSSRDTTTGKSATAALSTPRPLQAFRLDHAGQTQFSDAALRGKWTFLFFGYTHCPDICPSTLAEMARLHELLAQDDGILDDTRFVFVSVDPARDTPETLTRYARYFNPAFRGVTGKDQQLTALARQLDVRFRLGEGGEAGYNVDHSSAILLIDPQVRYHARFRAPHHARDIRQQFLDIRQRHDGNTP